MKTKKGFLLIDCIISMVCIMLLITPLFMSINIATKKSSYDTHSIKYIIDIEKSRIQKETNLDFIEKTYEKNGFIIDTKIEKKISDDIIKFKIKISKCEKQLSEFFYLKTIY